MPQRGRDGRAIRSWRFSDQHSLATERAFGERLEGIWGRYPGALPADPRQEAASSDEIGENANILPDGLFRKVTDETYQPTVPRRCIEVPKTQFSWSSWTAVEDHYRLTRHQVDCLFQLWPPDPIK